MTAKESGPHRVTAGEGGDGQTVPPSVVDAARAGNTDAFMAIYDAYATRLRGLAFRTLGDGDLLDDALQEVAIKAFLGLPQFRGDCAIGTWLFQITYRTCLNLRRGCNRAVPLPDIELVADEATTDPAESALQHLELTAALASLTAVQRSVVFLVLEEGLDHHTAARILGVPPGTIASRLSAARAALVRCLEDPRRDEEMQ
jgi:RNA polymerase sigma-70 factor (ECF subfamily)